MSLGTLVNFLLLAVCSWWPAFDSFPQNNSVCMSAIILIWIIATIYVHRLLNGCLPQQGNDGEALSTKKLS